MLFGKRLELTQFMMTGEESNLRGYVNNLVALRKYEGNHYHTWENMNMFCQLNFDSSHASQRSKYEVTTVTCIYLSKV